VEGKRQQYSKRLHGHKIRGCEGPKSCGEVIWNTERGGRFLTILVKRVHNGKRGEAGLRGREGTHVIKQDHQGEQRDLRKALRRTQLERKNKAMKEKVLGKEEKEVMWDGSQKRSSGLKRWIKWGSCNGKVRGQQGQ